MNKPFLQQVADYYIDNGIDLSRYTFVLPNKRSGMFMRMYLQLAMKRVSFMPRIVSITYFTQQYCDRPLGDNTELLFALYNAYNRVLERHGRPRAEYDSFAFWGNTMLNDFNDVDAYMADAHALFKNLHDQLEIRSYHLTEEQKLVIEQLWGVKVDDDPERFWAHMDSPAKPDSSKEKYISFWEILGEIYDEFNASLDAMPVPIVYPGRQSKIACNAIRELGADDMRDRRYAFVGFSALSTSRALIFRHLEKIKVADFFWDTASPYVQDENSSAGRYIARLARRIKMPEGFALDDLGEPNKVDIVSVPSNVGQTKAASSILHEWDADGVPDSATLIKTGVVMADPQLLIPMLYSLPEQYRPINVTMGFPYQSTPFAALLDSIFKMLQRADYHEHETYYLAMDIDEVLSHPDITAFAKGAVIRIKDFLTQSHIFRAASTELVEIGNTPSPDGDGIDLSFLFAPLKRNASAEQIKGYVENLVDNLRHYMSQISKINKAHHGVDSYEVVILDAYKQAIERVWRMACEYRVEMRDNSFITLLRKALVSAEIPFSGDPVKGLQVMDIMDARMLDFDRLIVLSANERVFPRKNAKPSLIIASLRKGYGLPTQDDEESSAAYQFFRIVSRASRVALIYDARTSGISSGEMSRNLSQLLYMPQGVSVRMRSVNLSPQSHGERKITIDKTPEVLAELDRFRPGGDLNFSASALKDYLKCPLKFYLNYVKRMRLETPAPEYMDAASYGTILHAAAEELYGRGPRLIDEKAIDEMLNSDINTIVLRCMDQKYYRGRYVADLDKVPGEGKVLAKLITRYIEVMLNCEKEKVKDAPYTFVSAEDNGGQKVHHWRVTDDYTINFKMSIDRLDDLGSGALRFIDYKTGNDDLVVGSIDKLFDDDQSKNSHPGGMFQVLAYCLAYSEINGFSGRIQPMIYRFVTMSRDGIPDLKIGKNVIGDFNIVRDEYAQRFRELIHKILEPNNEYPFKQTENPENCEYCSFIHMCGRFSPSNK